MSFAIRPFQPGDYDAVAQVVSAAFPGLLTTAGELRHEDEHRPAHCKAARWVAEVGGRVVATGGYWHQASRYHPRRFHLSVYVHPDFQGRSIGAALYATVLDALKEHDPIALQTRSREDLDRGVRFAASRGFREAMRSWESELDLAAFDPTPWLPCQERVALQGIAIRSLRELEADPGRDEKLLELVNTLRADLPGTEPATPLTPEMLRVRVLDNPRFLPDGYLIAVTADGRYVGSTNFWKEPNPDDLFTGLTGVRREYRGRGIAQALKLRALLWAKAQGVRRVRTLNASHNAPMLAINAKMGFVRKPAWIDYRLTLKEE